MIQNGGASLVGAAWNDLAPGQPFSGTIKPVWGEGNLVYNWEGGAVHPFVTAGAGVYRYGFDEHFSLDTFKGSDTTFGGNLGGGLEYFFTRHATFTGEVLYHRIGDVTTRLVPFNDHTSFWTISMGMKKYF